MAAATDLASIKTALEAIVNPQGYPPVQRVYSLPTEKVVTTAELPCFIIFWRKPPKVSFMTFGQGQEVVEYVVQFIYKPVGQGTLNENLSDILAYREPTLDALYNSMQLGGTVNWQSPIQCGLPQTLPEKWGGESWLGWDIIITVTDSRAITIGT